ncbi:hypothetical protein A2625_04870 [candidate division WOR-1 bacterium RIFCSPHIGHO2_01_FULL_53_15]|uniref:Uncharacterized protein n=1 Tax=candidate division WOR-1 bacterium RIFCSPHIGHO2_01_FULL_53_15 TaxID=1802564 RepID=A0A1F4Q2I2_UNCSA|nr:MAG: hypothetical protein A2625_04870 [candidate division WOR-1 bacterium RIFCSPHIGHO2_01_FULL_53_15]OGC13211.1 MAG: hypothetical protein A3D23_01125 [candidate division WOR-1 bacterium RIFCSPHIGHO2_02_FULL_53_26]
MKDKTLAALAYSLWIPSLYIVLTEKRRDEFTGFHGGQALLMWTGIFIIFFAVRFLVNLIWSFFYIPFLDVLEILAGAALYGYALYCGLRCYRGIAFTIPH